MHTYLLWRHETICYIHINKRTESALGRDSNAVLPIYVRTHENQVKGKGRGVYMYRICVQEPGLPGNITLET